MFHLDVSISVMFTDLKITTPTSQSTKNQISKKQIAALSLSQIILLL